MDVPEVSTFGNSYIAPFLVGSVWKGLSFSGALRTKCKLQEQAIAALHVEIEHLDINDPKQRLEVLQHADALVDWNNKRHSRKQYF